MKTATDVPVIIVGGGPVGLSASIMLSYNQIKSLLIEKNSSTSVFPKARLINGRTMEVFRNFGVEDQIRSVALPPDESDHSIWVKTLADGTENSRRRMLTIAPNEIVEKITPSPGCTSSQIDVERVLLETARERATKLSSQIKFNTELKSFVQESERIVVKVADNHTGSEEEISTRYLIAADGGHSRVREMLGIGTIGDKGLTQWVNIVFRANLEPWARGRRINICMIQNSAAPGALMPVANQKDTWTFGAVVQTSLKDYSSTEFCKQKVRAAVGIPELPVEIIRVGPWSVTARYSERFSIGRIFLAGDAAHETPPAGGFGMNTGVQDVYNLSWKLAFVIRGFASEELLSTYGIERQPVAKFVVTQALLNIASHQPTRRDVLEETLSSLSGKKNRNGSEEDRGRNESSSSGELTRPAGSKGSRSEHYNELGMIFGISYDRGALVPDGSEAPSVDNPVMDYVPSARPGSRLPHIWLACGKTRLSTIDLIGPYLLVLTGKSGESWRKGAENLRESSKVPIRLELIGSEDDGAIYDPSGQWTRVFGINDDGVIIVRPDGHIAWRSVTSKGNPIEELGSVVKAILSTGKT
jgi:putative polyketide hydroxylase